MVGVHGQHGGCTRGSMVGVHGAAWWVSGRHTVGVREVYGGFQEVYEVYEV